MLPKVFLRFPGLWLRNALPSSSIIFPKQSLISRSYSKRFEIPSLRSHTCGELRGKHVGERVSLCGWLEYQRMDKFAILRDAYGSTQVILNEDAPELKNSLKETPLESVVYVEGSVIKRPPTQVNKGMPTGEIEVSASNYKILNKVQKQLPFIVRSHTKALEPLRIKYRYLDLRYPEMQKTLRMRCQLLMKMREFLIKELDFVEVETPTLFKRTPGGAQEFVVPTQYPGEFFALTQSPQQFKQLLMVGGVDKYFQIARCYRDERSRPDRQPEFTQLDLELSFSNPQGVIAIVEHLIRASFPAFVGHLHFETLTYDQAMDMYGTDQPDLTLLPKIKTLNNQASDKLFWKYVVFKKAAKYWSSSLKKEAFDMSKSLFPDCRFHPVKVLEGDDSKDPFPIPDLKERLSLAEEDFLMVTSGSNRRRAGELLGKLRVLFGRWLRDNAESPHPTWFAPETYKPVWVVDFPLFEVDKETGELKACHHPFTQPHPQDIHLLHSDPLKVRGLHYDLVLNGWEIGGGSQRIHDPQLQTQILRDFLKIPTESLSHMLDALASGAPPHGGIALGIDRVVGILMGAKSIREVIAFPKGVDGRDALSGAPCPLDQSELALYSITTHAQEKMDKTTR